MRSTRALVPALLVVSIAFGCKSVDMRPRVQSPQRVAVNAPPQTPAQPSPVSASPWCHLTFRNENWVLCNIHYHRPAEHGTLAPGSRYVIPPCNVPGTTPDDWVEIHYAYVRGQGIPECNLLRETSLRSNLGRDCPSPYIVRSVWARVTPNGTFNPVTGDLPNSDSNYYIEYDGSSTGDTGGTSPAWWKINRPCLTVSEQALTGVHRDETRVLQPEAPPVDRPRSTQGN